MLNSDEIIKYIKDPLSLAIKQQVGVDLTIETIKKIKGDNHRYLGVHIGNIILKNKTLIPNYDNTYEMLPLKEKEVEIDGKEQVIDGWFLEEGPYSLTFSQGCKLPNNVAAEIIHRSSLNRLGCMIKSGIFDPGFETENMGATLYVSIPILIEYRARLAQIKMYNCTPTNNIYNGQYQKEKDIK
jgi:deoxycytidine triphosphate deaminase